MATKQEFQSLMTEIIAKQSIILGPGIALTKAQGLKGLTVNDSGQVTNLIGDEQKLLKNLINIYVDLSGEIIRGTMSSILDKYPSIKNASNN